MFNLKNLTRAQLIAELTKYFTTLPIDQANECKLAMDIAIEIHKDQEDRPDGPYVNHVLRVAVRLLRFGVRDHEVIIAALLHDGVEDQAEKLAFYNPNFNSKLKVSTNAIRAIVSLFGFKVATYVENLTNPENGSLSKIKRHKRYVDHVARTLNLPGYSGLMKISDFYDNGLDLHTISDAKFAFSMCRRYEPIFRLMLDAVSKYEKFWFLPIEVVIYDQIKQDLLEGQDFVLKMIHEEIA